MTTFSSTFGQLLIECFGGLLYQRGMHIFLTLSHGWALSQESHTLAHYIWLSGGSQFRHFSRYYVFLTESFWPKRAAFWLRIYAWIDRVLPTEMRVEVLLDDTRRKKSGKKIQGCAHYSNRAGSARQEYRVLWGLNFVYICLRVDWRGYQLSIPLAI